MDQFLFSYRMPAGFRPGSPGALAAWTAWFEELGDLVVDRGNPVFRSSTVGDCNPQTTLGGYTLVQADDLEAAVALAKGCPSLDDGGGVEVGAITVLHPQSAPS
jgi:YCII-related domain